jgi:glycerol kinase
LLDAMRRDIARSGISLSASLRVDGGMTANGWFMQRLADILGERIEVALNAETTALGAAYLAGQATGLYGSQAELQRAWVPARAFEPRMSADERDARYGGWLDAVVKVRSKA